MLADRIGGLRAVMAGSACQAVAVVAFLLTQSEVGLFAVSAAFGLGFSGIIPSYVVALRELFPSSEAAWRIPIFFFMGMSGMAFGSWLAGEFVPSLRLLCARIRRGRPVQSGEPLRDRLAGIAPGRQRANCAGLQVGFGSSIPASACQTRMTKASSFAPSPCAAAARNN